MYFLLPQFGIDGYFVSFALTHAVNFGLSLRKVLQIGGVRISGAFPALSIAAAVSGVIGGCCFAGSVQRIAAFLGLFLGVCFYTGTLGRGDVKWLRQMIFDDRKKTNMADATNS